MSQSNELSTVNNSTPAFVQDATNSLGKMEAYATMLIKSGLVPKHFYELDQYRNPIKDSNGVPKGNTAAVIMTIQHGLELGMSITQSLQQIVPVNGLMSVKGDAAKALIMKSGLCKEWIEEEVGSGDDFGLKITSTRKDGQKISRTFTIKDAKRAGLWIDDAMVAKNEKLRHSPWYKYQSRMLRYRALGFMARDLYGDVLQNMYTEDEARDLNEDNTVMITPDGMTAKITGQTNATSMVSAAEEQIAANKETESAPKPTRGRPSAPKKVVEEPKAKEEPAPQIEDAHFEEMPDVKTLEEVRALGNQETFNYVQQSLGFDLQKKLFDTHPEKKTKRILLELYSAHLAGQLETYIKSNFEVEETQPEQPAPEPKKEEPKAKAEVKSEPKQDGLFPELVDGQRDFKNLLIVADEFEKAGIAENDVMDFISDNGLTYTGMEDFYRHATVDMLEQLYNA
jgi:hypothetical protein